MSKSSDEQGVVIVGGIGFSLVLALIVYLGCTLWQDGYRAGIKESPGVTNVQGDQIITNTNSYLSPFSGNASKGEKNE